MAKKSYATPATMEHGGTTTLTLGAGGSNTEGGGLLLID